jgi:hypothetical protein
MRCIEGALQLIVKSGLKVAHEKGANFWVPRNQCVPSPHIAGIKFDAKRDVAVPVMRVGALVTISTEKRSRVHAHSKKHSRLLQ